MQKDALATSVQILLNGHWKDTYNQDKEYASTSIANNQ